VGRTADEAIRVSDQYYILATSARIDDRTRVLKHGDTFAVFDRFGDIDAFGPAARGLYHQDTRFLSRFALRMEGQRPLMLDSSIKDDNVVFTVDLMNADAWHSKEVVVPRGSVHLQRSKVLWQGTCFERVRAVNYAQSAIDVAFSVQFGADFADLFEVRGTPRPRRGRLLPPRHNAGRLVLEYEGLDGRRRHHAVLRHDNDHRDKAMTDVYVDSADVVVEVGGVRCPVAERRPESLGKHDRYPVKHFGFSRTNCLHRDRAERAIPEEERCSQQDHQDDRSAGIADPE